MADSPGNPKLHAWPVDEGPASVSFIRRLQTPDSVQDTPGACDTVQATNETPGEASNISLEWPCRPHLEPVLHAAVLDGPQEGLFDLANRDASSATRFEVTFAQTVRAAPTSNLLHFAAC